MAEEEEEEAFADVIEGAALGYSGPLPPPELLRQYEELAPGTVDRLLRLVAEEGRYRREVHKLEVENSRRERLTGQFLAAALSVLSLLTASYLVTRGRDAAGVVIAVTSLSATLAAFLASARK